MRTGAGTVMAALFGAVALVLPAGAAEDGQPQDASALVAGLGARTHVERVSARQQLVRIGTPAIPALRATLRDANPMARLEAARALGAIGGDAAGAALEVLIADEGKAAREGRWLDASLAYEGLLALGRTGQAGIDRVDAIAQGEAPDLAPLRHVAERAAADIVEPAIIAVFVSAHGGGSYAGRFAHLRKYGRPGVTKMLEIAASADPDRGDRFQEHAQLAIQALGDGDHPSIAPGLEALAAQFREGGIVPEGYIDEIAHSLFRLGRPAMLNATIAALEREVHAARMGLGNPTTIDRLGHRYLHADRIDDAVATFRSLAERSPTNWGNALYNEACAWSKGGDGAKAVAVLREAIVSGRRYGRVPYTDLDWMLVDGDLRAARELGGFWYVAACLVGSDRLGHDLASPPNPLDVQRALEFLQRAQTLGYHVGHQQDRNGVLVALRGRPEFEKLWKAMGGTRDGDSPDPGDGFEPPFGGGDD